VSGDLERLDADYRRKKAEIRADASLSWEQKERQVKALGDEHHARRRSREPEEMEATPPGFGG
jgi:hypothetical protein